MVLSYAIHRTGHTGLDPPWVFPPRSLRVDGVPSSLMSSGACPVCSEGPQRWKAELRAFSLAQHAFVCHDRIVAENLAFNTWSTGIFEGPIEIKFLEFFYYLFRAY